MVIKEGNRDKKLYSLTNQKVFFQKNIKKNTPINQYDESTLVQCIHDIFESDGYKSELVWIGE